MTRVAKNCLIKFCAIATVFSVAHAESGAEHSEHDAEKRHHFSIVTAGTHILDEHADHTAFTIGGDYEYRVNHLLGVGFVVEHAFGEIDATTLLAVADIHLWRGFALQVGPGVEITDGETHAAGRIGGLYELELEGGFTLSPQIHYDISHENSLVFGVGFGKAF